MCSIIEKKKANVFDLAWDTSLLDTENAMEFLGGRYCSKSDVMELIANLFDRNKRKLTVLLITCLLLQYMAIQNCQCLELSEVWEGW